MNKLLQRSLSIFAITLLLIALLVSVGEYFCSQTFWFEREFKEHSGELTDELGSEECVMLTHEMMTYLLGDREDISTLRASNSDKPFFNNRELHHLSDCRELFQRAKRLRLFSLVLALIIFSILIIKKKTTHLVRYYVVTTRIVVLLVGLCVAIVAISFDKAYDWLHELLFDNYLWILNPATDNLIKLMTTDIICETVGIVLTSWAMITLLLARILELISRRHMAC